MLRKFLISLNTIIVASAAFVFAPSMADAKAPDCSSFLTDKTCARFTYRCEHGYRGQSGRRYCYYLKRGLYYEQRLRRDCARKFSRGRYHPCKDIERRERYVAAYNQRHPVKNKPAPSAQAQKRVDPALKAKLASLEGQLGKLRADAAKVGSLTNKQRALNAQASAARAAKGKLISLRQRERTIQGDITASRSAKARADSLQREIAKLRGQEADLRRSATRLVTLESNLKSLQAEISKNGPLVERERQIMGELNLVNAELGRARNAASMIGRMQNEINNIRRQMAP